MKTEHATQIRLGIELAHRFDQLSDFMQKRDVETLSFNSELTRYAFRRTYEHTLRKKLSWAVAFYSNKTARRMSIARKDRFVTEVLIHLQLDALRRRVSV